MLQPVKAMRTVWMFHRLIYLRQAYTWGKVLWKPFFSFFFFLPPFFFFLHLQKTSFSSFLKPRIRAAHQYWNFIAFASFAEGHMLGSFDQNCQPWEKKKFSTVTWPILPTLSCLKNKICASKSFCQEFIGKASKHCRQRRISSIS